MTALVLCWLIFAYLIWPSWRNLEDLLIRRVGRFDIVKTIDGKESLYLRRFFLYGSATSQRAVYLHLIKRGDEDPDPHDHPWDFTTFVLRGEYTDERWHWDGQRRRFIGLERVRWFARRKSDHLHRVRLHPGDEAWTVVFRGPKKRGWTFVKETGPVPWRRYLGLPDDAPHDSPYRKGREAA